MTGGELLYFGFGCFLIGLSLFCANLLFLRKRHRQVYWPLALFFVAEVVSSIPMILDAVAEIYDADTLVLWLQPLNLPSSMMLAPLFWLYVRGLTTEGSLSDVRYRFAHLLPVLFGVAVLILFYLLPLEVHEAFERGEDPAHPLANAAVYSIWALTIVFYVQVGIYLFMTIRLLTSYNTRLKDLFASTENRELYWVWWIMLVSGCFLIFNSANILLILLGVEILPKGILEQPVIGLFFSSAVIWVLALWGLRQKPGLIRDANPGARDEIASSAGSQKYERSALSEEQAQRLARKIRSAMQSDLLYRDPNLSLWDLSKHIGVTSNYLSQTLNETMGNNFFDYVNRWRIEDAVKRVQTTDETVLTIAYDVGFNSKSSFYKAFKRHVGMTPTALREARSANGQMVVNIVD